MTESEEFDLCNAKYLEIEKSYNLTGDLTEIPFYDRTILLVWWTMGVVDNGGFQYLFECTLEGDPECELTARAFAVIGCDKAARAIVGATAIFPDGKVIKDHGERQDYVKLIGDSAFEDFNRTFWDASDLGEGEICGKLAAFILNKMNTQ